MNFGDDAMQCEMCGKDIDSPNYVIVDGVKMIVCKDCTKYGKLTSPPPIREKVRIVIKKGEKTDDRIFQSMEKTLVPDWAERIKKGRMEKGLSREELGAKIGEPTNAIAKMENGDLRPSDETAKKLEKILGIQLFEKIEDIHLPTRSSDRGLTLGDLIKFKSNK